MPSFYNTNFTLGNVVGSISDGFPMVGTITQVFGQTSVTGSKHGGVDIGAPHGTPIYAPDEGIVHSINTWGGFGNWIVLRHPDNIFSGYAHLSSFDPSMFAGRWVAAGEVLGYCGTTGTSTGNHLHWMVATQPNFPLDFSVLIDPVTYIITEENDVLLRDRVDRLERLMGANGVSTTPVSVDAIGNPIIGALLTGEPAMQWMDTQGFSMHLGFAIQEAKVRKFLGGV